MTTNARCIEALRCERFDEENCSTKTSEEQIKVEESVEELFQLFSKKLTIDINAPSLFRGKHVSYLKKCLFYLPNSYECLDASRPWLCYWILHSLELLEETLDAEDRSKIALFIGRCQSPDGGFGGGPGQHPHLAPTYAAVNALCTLGTEEAFSIINRETLRKFLWTVRCANGSFQMHVGGEEDIRGVYCALSVARLTNIYCDKLFENSAKWIISCQTYEGGFAGCPGLEAHGGYAFCGLAALCLLGKEHLCDIRGLLRWVAHRQMRFEGGFQGRTNKLVDGCYSFWQGGAFPLLHKALADEDSTCVSTNWLFHQEALQEYILICCQNSLGGLLDKPGKPRDIYHTCYTLSGLSVAQHCFAGQEKIVGGLQNELARVHPLYNISQEAYINASKFFYNLPPL
ncbi:Protein farnesyltransferase subunit beta [Gryllus bimaculatus]|nr:Protein farnesyltransferase subunit beta [Gryllus bimaculatus]